jgi:hypothetical protein
VLCTTLIFAELYIAFPMRGEISPDGIAKKLGLSSPNEALPSGRRLDQVLSQTLQWLTNEGYVQGPTGIIGGHTLTSKALTSMNVVPPSLSGEVVAEPLGPQILTAATDTSSAHGNTVIQTVMGKFFGSIGKST